MPGPVLELPRGSAIEPLHSALVVPYLLSEETILLIFHPSRKDQEETALFGISRCIGDNGTFDVTQPSSDVVNLELGDFDRNREQVPMGIRRARADSDRRMAELERKRFLREHTDLRQRERDYEQNRRATNPELRDQERDYERNRRATNPELRDQERDYQRDYERNRRATNQRPLKIYVFRGRGRRKQNFQTHA